MVTAVRIYVEGGGDSDNRDQLRLALNTFLSALLGIARSRGIGWAVIACGPRGDAYRAFCRGLRSHPQAFNVLLVDSEGPVPAGAGTWAFLGWDARGCDDARCHLMVQCMEAWLVADPDALASFYKHGFRRHALPRRKNVEDIPKQQLLDALNRATRGTPAGAYHKTAHAPKILMMVDPRRARAASAYCNRLFENLAEAMTAL